MDFRQQLRALIERHITSSSPYGDYVAVQIAMQQELVRLELETDRFSDEEMIEAGDVEAMGLMHFDLRDFPALVEDRAGLATSMGIVVERHPDSLP